MCTIVVVTCKDQRSYKLHTIHYHGLLYCYYCRSIGATRYREKDESKERLPAR
jgi:hypothetical protein